MAEPAVGDIDDVALDPLQLGITEAAVLHDPGREILADDVRDGDQLAQQLSAFRGAQIDCHAVLADVVVVESGAEVDPATIVDVGADPAQRVPQPLGRGIFDPDHLGAECSQDLGGSRACELATQIAHPKVRQRAGHGSDNSS
jgi:hypothetical protein